MYKLWDHNDQFHWFEAIKSWATNQFSYKFSSSNKRLVKTLTWFGSYICPTLDGSRYSISNNGYMSQPHYWLATKARGLQVCGPISRPGSHITCSRECKECVRVSPHTPKWTPMLGVGESWSPKRTPKTSESILRGQNSMAWCALYINGKILKCRCLKWARIAHLGI